MDEINYLDFDIHIQQTDSGYRVKVVNSPAGQASGEFEMPFSELEIENFVLRVGRTRKVFGALNHRKWNQRVCSGGGYSKRSSATSCAEIYAAA
jgi:hypothetical protein